MASNIENNITLLNNSKNIFLLQKLFVSIRSYLPLFSQNIGPYFVENSIAKKLKVKQGFLLFYRNSELFFLKA